MRIVSFLLLLSAWATGAWAGGEHAHSHGHEEMHGPDAHWMAPAEAAGRVNPVPADVTSIQRGRAMYTRNCASCHGTDGRGDGPAGMALNPRPANLAQMAGTHPDGDLAWKIEHGRGPMPGWRGTLGQGEIWDLVNYIQSLAGDDRAHGHAGTHPHGEHAH